MFLLLDSRKKILEISEICEKGVFEEDNLTKWKVNASSYLVDNNYSCVEVSTVPTEVIPEKYYYIDGEFVENPNFSSTGEIAVLKATIETLTKQNATLQSNLDAVFSVLDTLLLE